MKIEIKGKGVAVTNYEVFINDKRVDTIKSIRFFVGEAGEMMVDLSAYVTAADIQVDHQIKEDGFLLNAGTALVPLNIPPSNKKRIIVTNVLRVEEGDFFGYRFTYYTDETKEAQTFDVPGYQTPMAAWIDFESEFAEYNVIQEISSRAEPDKPFTVNLYTVPAKPVLLVKAVVKSTIESGFVFYYMTEGGDKLLSFVVPKEENEWKAWEKFQSEFQDYHVVEDREGR